MQSYYILFIFTFKLSCQFTFLTVSFGPSPIPPAPASLRLAAARAISHTRVLPEVVRRASFLRWPPSNRLGPPSGADFTFSPLKIQSLPFASPAQRKIFALVTAVPPLWPPITAAAVSTTAVQCGPAARAFSGSPSVFFSLENYVLISFSLSLIFFFLKN